MLRVNVGLSRKVSKDYNSTGFSINLDGEVTAAVGDPEAVIEQVKELFDLAEEALDREIERHQSDTALAGRDEEPANQNGSGHTSQNTSNGSRRRFNHAGGNGHSPGNGTATREPSHQPDAATNKQINYLLNIGKRNRLSTLQLEQKVGEILGNQVGLYDLTKSDAARVIDALTSGSASGQTNGRR